MIYKVAICDDEINQCAVLEKIIIEYFNNRAEKYSGSVVKTKI